jgi:hypothetical protein
MPLLRTSLYQRAEGADGLVRFLSSLFEAREDAARA